MARTEDVPSLAAFVGQRNENALRRDTSLDDIKIPVKPTKGTANTHVMRNPDGLTTRKRTTVAKTERSRQSVPRALQDTDTSLGTTTTTTASTNRAPSADEPHGQVLQTVPSHTPHDEPFDRDEFESYSEYSDEDVDEQELHDGHPKGLVAVQMTASNSGAPNALQAKSDGRGLGRISGDTYPETTSGRPSTVHADDHREYQTATYAQTDSAQPIMMPERGAGTRLSFAPFQNVQLAQHGVSRHQDAGLQQSFVPPLGPEEMLKEVQSGFSYGMAASKRPQATRTQSAQTPASQRHSTKAMPASTHHRGPSVPGNQCPIKGAHNGQPAHQTRSDFQHVASSAIPGVHKLHPPQNPPQQQYRHHDNQSLPALVVEVSKSEMTSDFGNEDHHRHMLQKSLIESPQPQSANSEPVPLDYDVPSLYAKTFNDLKTAPFDADPNAANHQISSPFDPDDALPKKLQTLLSMEGHAKQDFFASLGIDEWEVAGDWFLESFSKLMQRFKIARQEKRKMAREFENEIELRYETVSKKQKLTAGALNEMKESGGKVLQGTPKKDVRPAK